MNLRSLFFLVCFSAALPLSAHAEAQDKTPQSKLDQYIHKLDQKFDKGALNFTAGWTEVIRRPIDHYQHPGNKNRTLYALQGAGTGLAAGLIDTVGGFFNAATAFMPQWEIPLPQKGIRAQGVTGANSEVFGSEFVSGDYIQSDISKISPNL